MRLILRGFRQKQDLLIVLFLFVLSLIVYLSNGRRIESSDAVPASILPFLIVRQKTIYFDGFVEESRLFYHGKDPYSFFLHSLRGHSVSAFPIVLPVVLTPLYFFYNLSLEVRGIPFTFHDIRYLQSHLFFLKLSSSLITAFSGILLYVCLLRIWRNKRVALLTTGIYLFGSNAWVINSQELWQHGLENLLFYSLIFLSLRYFIEDPSHRLLPYTLMGGLLALFILNRPGIFALSFPFFFTSLLLLSRGYVRSFVGFLMGFLLSGFPFFVYNHYFFGNFLLGSYAFTLDSIATPKLTALAGMFFSPSKGFFIYSPVFLFSIIGIYLSFRSRKSLGRYFFLSFLPMSILYILIVATLKHWTGSMSYGPRYFNDILPLLSVYLSFFVHRLLFQKFPYRRFVAILFSLTVVFSVFVQFLGAFHFSYQWDKYFDQPGVSQEDLVWDWKNSQILFMFRNHD
ncbi:MAG TPA: hypothetical protein VJ179_00830 [Patescibacteria group bacterium]|uniref:Glycosyltransferase RgtA/B/C/D-like domain-containing protein n=1 Tax=Candidatus Chisholmbacteria bacterium RIFCSPHIGHO2_01_FULL_52_32 TaxID=1797591 RepID=A0A1G1VTZ9_9BACT|nr:MAG: hypothetical protein A2786_05435 [Candidatus Chisholmbacteria bacterium RIFCSPHIGHO2_01_FULL_52_32]OGY19726.1 MAG: hypothetical protein A2900_01305 [Candidatus Chisholmbacteria bacterium RIFCSPLOWO2_01_FULL_50_28]HKZ34399.1 hypothetical protein [Patescibacteria group bacterium]